MIGSIASPYLNSLLGLQNNTGSSVGSMVGGGLGTLGGALVAASAIPGAGWIAGGIAALGSLLGGGIGSLFGGQPKQEPKLEVDLNAALWRPMGEQQWGMAGGATKVGSDTGGYWVQTETTHGASGQADMARAFAELGEQVHKQSWAIADMLGDVDSSMKSQYLSGLEAQGTQNVHVIHRGDWINDANIQDLADWYVSQSTGAILKALGAVDLTPVTIAADGMAADTAEEIAASFSKIFSFVNSGTVIEDEDMRASFTERATEQMRSALDNISLEPLARTANGMAVTTVDEFSKALADVFSVYDLSANLADEGAKAEFQSWAQTAIEKAFASTDTSFLRVDFDKSSFGGLQQAYAAIQAWEEVEKGIEAVINPMSEFDSQMDAARIQFDSWLDTLRALGWQEEALAEVEAKRASYMEAYRESLVREQEQNISLRLSALRYGSGSNEYALQSLKYQQENELSSLKKQFGESSPVYATVASLQKAETSQTVLDMLKAQRENLLQKEQQAVQERISAEQQALQERMSAIQKEISEANSLASTFRLLVKSLEDFRRDLWSGENNLTGSRYQEAYSQFDALYNRAMSGDEEAFNSLESKAGELLSLGREQLPERGEYNDLFYEVDQKLKNAQEFARDQLSEAERQLDALNSQLEAMQAQQEVLNAQLEAMQRQTEIEEASLLSLQQIDEQIAAMEILLRQQIADAGQPHAASVDGWDWERLIREKVGDLNADAYKGKTDWDRASFLSEVASYGVSLEDWYKIQGRTEGYVLHAAQTTNATIDAKISDLDYNIDSYVGRLNADVEHYLESNAKFLDGTLQTQLVEALEQGVSLDGLLETETASWPQALAKMDNMATTFQSFISSLQSSIASAIAAAARPTGGGSGGTASAPSTSGGGIYGSTSYSSEQQMLQARAQSYNGAGYLGSTSWTAASTKAHIESGWGSVENWYRKAGHAEIGFADGGITPANKVYMVGERGTELMVSPRQWGVLNHEATEALMNRNTQPIQAVKSGGNDDALRVLASGLAELAGYMRQLVRKTDKVAWSSQKCMDSLREINVEGVRVAS